MWLLLLATLPGQTAVETDVQLLSGASRTGAIVAISNEKIDIDVNGELQSLDVRDLQSLSFVEPTTTSDGSIANWVRLADGSQLLATRYTVQNRQVTISMGSRQVVAETRSVKAVRFREPSPDLDKQWQEAVASEITGDTVVLRRDEDTLDQLEGVLRNVDETTVEFEFDEELIPVKREKLEGVVYFHRAGRQLPEPLCRVYERNGSTWFARTIQLGDSGLQLHTPSDVKAVVPLNELARIDFSSGNVVFLADMEPETIEWTPYVGSRVALPSLAKLYLPLKNRSFEGPGLSLNDKDQVTTYQRGLAIHSRTLLVYRLSGDFRRFTALVGIDSRLHGNGNLELVISADEKELFRRAIDGDQAPIAVDLDVEGVNRLKILVDFGQGLDVADHLNLCNAKVIK